MMKNCKCQLAIETEKSKASVELEADASATDFLLRAIALMPLRGYTEEEIQGAIQGMANKQVCARISRVRKLGSDVQEN